MLYIQLHMNIFTHYTTNFIQKYTIIANKVLHKFHELTSYLYF